MPADYQRVDLDTNLWINFLISNTLSKIDQPIHEGRIRLLFSEESLGEFLEVAARPNLAKYFSRADMIALLAFMGEFENLIKVHSKVEICRDPNDNFLLALAVDGEADYLVTGEKDLLVIK